MNVAFREIVPLPPGWRSIYVSADGPLYEAYRTWALAAGWKKPMTATAFGRALTERGFTADRASTADRTRVRRGLALRGRP